MIAFMSSRHKILPVLFYSNLLPSFVLVVLLVLYLLLSLRWAAW